MLPTGCDDRRTRFRANPAPHVLQIRNFLVHSLFVFIFPSEMSFFVFVRASGQRGGENKEGPAVKKCILEWQRTLTLARHVNRSVSLVP